MTWAGVDQGRWIAHDGPTLRANEGGNNETIAPYASLSPTAFPNFR